jgi:hypothetical protein
MCNIYVRIHTHIHIYDQRCGHSEPPSLCPRWHHCHPRRLQASSSTALVTSSLWPTLLVCACVCGGGGGWVGGWLVVCVCACVCVCARARVCVCDANTHTPTHTHKYIYIYMYICIGRCGVYDVCVALTNPATRALEVI